MTSHSVKILADMALPATLALLSDQIIDSGLHKFTIVELACFVVLTMELGILAAFLMTCIAPRVISESLLRCLLLLVDLLLTAVFFLIRKFICHERIIRGVMENSIACIFHSLKVIISKANANQMKPDHWLDHGLERYGPIVVENTKRLLNVVAIHIPMVIYQTINVLAEAIFLSQMKYLLRDYFNGMGNKPVDIILIVCHLSFVILVIGFFIWLPKRYERYITNLRAVGVGYTILTASLVCLVFNQLKIDEHKHFPPNKYTAHLRVYNVLPTVSKIESSFISQSSERWKSVEPYTVFLIVKSLKNSIEEASITISNAGANLNVTGNYLIKEKESRSLLVTETGIIRIKTSDDLQLDVWDRPTLVVFCAMSDSECKQKGTVDLPLRDDYYIFLVEGQGKNIRLIRQEPHKVRPEPDTVHFSNVTIDLQVPVKTSLIINDSAVYAMVFFKSKEGYKNVSLIRVIHSKTVSESIEVPFMVTSSIGFLTFEIFILSHIMRDRPPALSCTSFTLFSLSLTIPPMILIDHDIEYAPFPCLEEICVSVFAFIVHIAMAFKYWYKEIPHTLERDESISPTLSKRPLKSALKKSILEPASDRPTSNFFRSSGRGAGRSRQKKKEGEHPLVKVFPTSSPTGLLEDPQSHALLTPRTRRKGTRKPKPSMHETAVSSTDAQPSQSVNSKPGVKPVELFLAAAGGKIPAAEVSQPKYKKSEESKTDGRSSKSSVVSRMSHLFQREGSALRSKSSETISKRPNKQTRS